MKREAQYSWNGRPIVKLFAEKVVLAATVPVLVLIAANPMAFDWQQRVSISLAALFFAYFIAHTLEKSKDSNSYVPLPSVGGFTSNQKTPTEKAPEKTSSVNSNSHKEKPSIPKKGQNPQPINPLSDRSIKVGNKAQVINSPMTTGDNSPVTITETPTSPPSRELSEERFNRLVKELSVNAGMEADIFIVQADDEARTFGNQIQIAFEKSRWKGSYEKIGSLNITMNIPGGVTSFNGDGFTCSAKEGSQELTAALQAFSAINLKCVVRHDLPSSAPLSIYIGKNK